MPRPVQPVTATQRARRATSVTQYQASASAGREPLGVSAQTANRASGASPAAAPASVTAMWTSVTPAPGSAEAAGTSQRDTSVSGKESLRVRLDFTPSLAGYQTDGKCLSYS